MPVPPTVVGTSTPKPAGTERGRSALLTLVGVGLFALGAVVGYQLRFHSDLANLPKSNSPPRNGTRPITPLAQQPASPPELDPARAAWQAAESLFEARKFAEAQSAYRDFQKRFAQSPLFKTNATVLTERFKIIEAALHPQPQPGLIGRYFVGRDFQPEQLLMERVDLAVDFAWGGDQPAPPVPADGFCVRWEGMLRVKHPGRYVLATVSDDGTRVTIDGAKILEQWVDQADTRVGAEIELTAGDHPLIFEFYENGGAATARLLWSLQGSFDETLIPAEALWHNPVELKEPPTRPAQVTPTPPGKPNEEDHF